jgi:hypothetical protein
MPPERMEEIQVELSNYFIDSIYKARKDLLYELFPKLKNRPSGKIKHEDVDDLKVRFETIVKGIIDDRDNNRAHRFESLKSRSVTPRLGFKELGEKFEKVEKILNAIKIVSTGENFAYNDLNFASKDETSWDLIFSILWNGKKTLDMVSGVNKQLNSCPSETKVYGWMLLKKLLEDSHRKHDELQEEIRMNPTAQGIEEKKKLCFNDMKMEENWR